MEVWDGIPKGDVDQCPMCSALPCDWVDNPHKVEFSLLSVLADIRKAIGCGDKPMMSELAGVIRDKLDQYPRIIAMVRDSELRNKNEALERVELLSSWEIPPLWEISEASSKANQHMQALVALKSIDSAVAIESVPISTPNTDERG